MAARRRSAFMIDPGPLGARLRRIRTDHGIPVGGVGGVPRSTLEQLEAGHGLPSLDTAVRLADAYKVTLDHLIGRDAAVRSGSGCCRPDLTVPSLPPGLPPAGEPAQSTHASSGSHAASTPALGDPGAGLRGPSLAHH